MKEPHGKELANRSNLESCAGHGNTTGVQTVTQLVLTAWPTREKRHEPFLLR